MEVVGQHFRPEFISRVDEMVVLHPLAQEQIREIAVIQLEIENPSAQRILAGDFASGDSIQIDVEEGRSLRLAPTQGADECGPMINDSAVPPPAAETWHRASPTFPAPIRRD